MNYKRILSAFIVLSILVMCLPVMPIAVSAATGTGTVDDPVIIKTAQDFADYFANGVAESQHKGKYFELKSDIILPDDFVPNSKSTKMQSFDGKGHSITINYSGSATYPSVFGRWDCGNVSAQEEFCLKNLVVKGSVSGGISVNAAGAVSVVDGYGTYNFINIVNEANVLGGRSAGGILGNFFANSNTSPDGKGIVVNIKNCVNYGSIKTSGSGFGATGGIVGFYVDQGKKTDYGVIENCINYGNISSDVVAGGITGRIAYGQRAVSLDIKNCANYGNIKRNDGSAKSEGFGGIIGSLISKKDVCDVTVSSCFNAGTVSGASYTSGVVGIAANKIAVENCFNTGVITRVDNGMIYGAILGENVPEGSSVKNCYNVGAFVTAATNSRPIYTVVNGVSITAENNYFCDDNTYNSNLYGLTETDESTFTTVLQTGFDNNVWSFIEMDDANGNYYKFPQLLSNPYYYDFASLKDCESAKLEYNPFITASEENGTVTGGILKEFKDGLSIYKTEENGKYVSPFGTYPELYDTSLVEYDLSNGFEIDKSAIIFAVTKDVPMTNDGFTPVLSKDNKNAMLSLKDATQYYVSSKTVLTDSQSEQVNVSGVEALFVKWIDSVTLTVPKTENATVKIDGVEKDNEVVLLAKGVLVDITVIPDEGYYLEKLTANNEDILTTKLEEDSGSYTADEDATLTLALKTYELDRKIIETREESGNGISQEFIVCGNATKMAKDKKVSVKFELNGTTKGEGSSFVGADGNYEIKMTEAYSSGDYKITLTLEINPSYKLNFIIADEGKDTFYISSVASLSTLLTTLNTNKGSIACDSLVSQILTDPDLNFEIDVFKNLDTPLQENIVAKFLDYTDYNVSNIYERFDNAVIFESLKNSSLQTDNVKKILEVYEDLIDVGSGAIYGSIFNTLTDTDKIYDSLKGLTYNNYQDIVDQFNFACAKEKMLGVINFTEIMDTLSDYDDELGITNEITTYNNFVLYKQNIVSEYIFGKLNGMKVYNDLKTVFLEAITKADLQNPPVVTEGVTTPSYIGGGGGSASIKVDLEYIEGAKQSVETIEKVLISDISDVAWAKDAILTLVDKNIIRGYDDGTFKPANNITRAEFVKLIVTAFEFKLGENKVNYIDVKPDDWYYDYIVNASMNSIVNGKTSTEFKPDDLITRQEMAVVLHRVLFKYNKIGRTPSVTFNYTDNDKIAEYAEKAVAMLTKMELINGFPDGSFGPQLNTTRAEAAYMIYKVMNYVNE